MSSQTSSTRAAGSLSPLVIRMDRGAGRRARIVASLLLLASVFACALLPRSPVWVFLAVAIFALWHTALASRRDLPRLEIYPDELVLKQLFLNDVTVRRSTIALFAVHRMKRGEALVAFTDPPPFKLLAPVPRASDTVLPSNLEVSLPELHQLLTRWLAAGSSDIETQFTHAIARIQQEASRRSLSFAAFAEGTDGYPEIEPLFDHAVQVATKVWGTPSKVAGGPL